MATGMPYCRSAAVYQRSVDSSVLRADESCTLFDQTPRGCYAEMLCHGHSLASVVILDPKANEKDKSGRQFVSYNRRYFNTDSSGSIVLDIIVSSTTLGEVRRRRLRLNS